MSSNLIIEKNKINVPSILELEKIVNYNRLKSFYDYKQSQWKTMNFFKIKYNSLHNEEFLKISGFLIEPINIENQKLPVIIYNRGGSKEVGVISEEKILNELSEFASWGFIVIGTQYSGNDGSEGKDQCGGEEVNDIINLFEVLKEVDNVDFDKINMIGVSRGGLMTHQVLNKIDWVKKAVTKAGATNEFRAFDQRPELKEFLLDCYDTESEIEKLKRSPSLWSSEEFENYNTPVLILHGSNDDKVSLEDSLDMVNTMDKYSKDYKLVIYSGEINFLIPIGISSINH